LKKQTEEAELRMTQMKEKQQRSIELNAAKMSGKKIKFNVDKDAEEVEEETEETETPDPARAGVLAALEREREIEAKLRSEEVARDGKFALNTTNQY
jgi:methyl coenzyme M reductase gamma subunit